MQFTKGTTRNPLFQTQRDNTTESRVQYLHIRSNFSSLMINSPTTEILASNSFTTRTGRGLV